MGMIDIEGKKYLSDSRIFADTFNYLLYNGNEIIKPDELTELDTAEIVVPYGNEARVPTQKFRDVLKIWNVMKDDRAVYVVLGAELQTKINYGMPVRSGLYDMLGYADQIDELKKSYSTKHERSETEEDADESGSVELAVDDGNPRLRLSTSEEFLSGMRKEDKLLPIVSAVIYFGDKPWDGPKSLFDMLDVEDENIYSYLNDYKLNLISPMDMDDKEFEKFNTDLGFAMKMIKHQKDDVAGVIRETDHRRIDRDTAFFLNRAINLGLKYEEDGNEGGFDMCVGMDRMYKENQVVGAIDVYKDLGFSKDDIINNIIRKYNVTKEYVLALLEPQEA